jgi:hypothetical protein
MLQLLAPDRQYRPVRGLRDPAIGVAWMSIWFLAVAFQEAAKKNLALAMAQC